MVGFLVADFLSKFPGKIGFHLVTENFTTFFTPRQEICQVQLTRASSPIQPVGAQRGRLSARVVQKIAMVARSLFTRPRSSR